MAFEEQLNYVQGTTQFRTFHDEDTGLNVSFINSPEQLGSRGQVICPAFTTGYIAHGPIIVQKGCEFGHYTKTMYDAGEPMQQQGTLIRTHADAIRSLPCEVQRALGATPSLHCSEQDPFN